MAVMGVVGRVAAGFLVVTRAAVAVNLAATPLYHDGAFEYPVWEVLNWFMAVGVVAVLAAVFLDRHTQGSRGKVVVGAPESVAWFSTARLCWLPCFSGSGFWTLYHDSETGDAVTSHLVYFPVC